MSNNESQNPETDDKTAEISRKIQTDWEVDSAGNTYAITDKTLVDLAYLKDEFKESN